MRVTLARPVGERGDDRTHTAEAYGFQLGQYFSCGGHRESASTAGSTAAPTAAATATATAPTAPTAAAAAATARAQRIAAREHCVTAR